MATHTAKDAREVRNARLRREVDKDTMEALDDMIPSEHFEGIGDDDDRPYGEKAKTMKAAGGVHQGTRDQDRGIRRANA